MTLGNKKYQNTRQNNSLFKRFAYVCINEYWCTYNGYITDCVKDIRDIREIVKEKIVKKKL